MRLYTSLVHAKKKKKFKLKGFIDEDTALLLLLQEDENDATLLLPLQDEDVVVLSLYNDDEAKPRCLIVPIRKVDLTANAQLSSSRSWIAHDRKTLQTIAKNKRRRRFYL